MDAVLTSTSAHADIAMPAQRFARALLHHAPPGHPDAGFFATVIGTSLAHHDLARSGLCPEELADLLDYLFPGALASPTPGWPTWSSNTPPMRRAAGATPSPALPC